MIEVGNKVKVVWMDKDKQKVAKGVLMGEDDFFFHIKNEKWENISIGKKFVITVKLIEK